MKSMVNKVKTHGKKIIIHLKRHHRKYFYGMMCCAILSLVGIFTASTINSTFADEEQEVTSITYDTGANIMYVDTEGREFTGIGTITISNLEDSITMLDRNLGATTNDVNDTGSYGYHFQWGNNYGFDPFDESILENATTGKATWSGIYINKGYYGNIFLKSNDNTFDYWIDSVENNGNHYNLWGGLYEDNINNTDNNVLTNLSGDNWVVTNPKDRQGPCPDGYHIPNYGELLKIKSMLNGDFSFHDDLLIPFAGGRGYNASLAGEGNFAKLWSSSPVSSTSTYSFSLQIYVDYPVKIDPSGRISGGSIRCFKDTTPALLHVEFFDGEESIWSGTVESGATASGVRPSDPQKNGFTFAGWYKTGATSPFNFNTPITGDLNLYAKRNEIVTNQVIFFDSGTIIASGTVVSGTTASGVRPSDPHKDGYAFSGWYLSGATTPFNFNTPITGDLNLYAKWIKTYQINFIDSGTIIASGTVVSGATASGVRPSNPHKAGYTFSGRYLSGASESFNFNTVITGDLNLYAKRYETPKVTVRNSNEMMSMYNEDEAISCEYSYRSGTYLEQIIMYAKNGKIYEDSTFSDYDNENSGYVTIYTRVLVKNDKIFGWGTLFGSGKGVWADYEDFNLEDAFHDLFDDLRENEVFMCATGVNDTSIFDLPDGIVFYDGDHFHFSFDEDVSFLIGINDTINAGEYTDFSIKVIKDGSVYKDYTGTVIFALLDKNGNYVDPQYYTIANNGFYDFTENDKGKKTFKNGLKIKKAGTYVLQVEGLNGGMGEEFITVNGDYDDFDFDSYSYNPNYSDEMNRAYLFARYYDITTKNSIKDAKMGSGLNRIAMAKMLTNYAENVLGMDDFNTSRNCKFTDVSTSLDASYDYGVTRACQLGIMGVNMPNNKFYPNGGVTRAEFATALSRLLFNTKDGTDKYYSTHISKLYREGIISNTDPKLREKRGYVMLMLMRATMDYDD